MAVIDTFFFDELSHYKDYGLRDYQAYLKCEIYTKWKDNSSILLQMTTGTGKTRLFVSIINDFKQYSESHNVEVKVLIVTHRKELVDQIKSELFYNYNIKSTLIKLICFVLFVGLGGLEPPISTLFFFLIFF